MITPFLRSLLIAAVAVSAALPASASIARAVTFDEKVASADAVVLGKVVSRHSGLDPSGRWILTWSTFEVEKALKGNAVDRVTVITPGGTHDGIRQETIGSPQFQEGKEHVIFLASSPSGQPTVAYLDQGVYDVRRDARGRPMITPAASKLILIDQATGRAGSATGEAATPESLDQFQARIQQSVRRAEQHRSMQMQPSAEEKTADATGSVRAFARQNWKLLLLVGVGLLLAVIPLLTRLSR